MSPTTTSFSSCLPPRVVAAGTGALSKPFPFLGASLFIKEVGAEANLSLGEMDLLFPFTSG